MSEAHEPSYYEIALTNRQVLVAFVVLLLCVLAAFVGGIWLGRSDGGAGGVVVADDATAEDLAALEEFKFFSEQRDGTNAEGDTEATSRPDLSGIRNAAPAGEDPAAERQPPPPPRATTLAEDVGQAPPPKQVPPPPKPSPPPPKVEPSPPPPPRTTPATTTTTSATAEPSSGFVIQVFSTKDDAQAKKVREQLAGGGYKAYLSPVQVGSSTMYRVRIGPYRDRASAEKSASAVNQTFKLDTWVTAAGG